jgi:hypothetical protein
MVAKLLYDVNPEVMDLVISSKDAGEFCLDLDKSMLRALAPIPHF